MKKILFVLSVLFMMVVVGCSTPTTDNSVEETVVQTPANPQTPSTPVVDKSPFEYVKPACVNLADYTVGADKGGAVALFDDFDIDYNAYKYLIETRMSGALTTPFSAIIMESIPASE